MTNEEIQKELTRLGKKVSCKGIKYSSGALSGTAGCYTLGVDYTTGDLYYKDEDSLWQVLPSGGSSSDAWLLDGNSGLMGKFLGTTGGEDLYIKTDDTDIADFKADGNINLWGYTKNATATLTILSVPPEDSGFNLDTNQNNSAYRYDYDSIPGGTYDIQIGGMTDLNEIAQTTADFINNVEGSYYIATAIDNTVIVEKIVSIGESGNNGNNPVTDASMTFTDFSGGITGIVNVGKVNRKSQAVLKILDFANITDNFGISLANTWSIYYDTDESSIGDATYIQIFGLTTVSEIALATYNGINAFCLANNYPIQAVSYTDDTVTIEFTTTPYNEESNNGQTNSTDNSAIISFSDFKGGINPCTFNLESEFTIKGDAGTVDYVLSSRGQGLPPIWKQLTVSVPDPLNFTNYITKNSDIFVHTYGQYQNSYANLFIGKESGNQTMTTSYFNVGLGNQVLQDLTTGTGNFAIGAAALKEVTNGDYNVGIGVSALQNCTTGDDNLAIGTAALANLLTGNRNTAIGRLAGATSTGSDNVLIGYSAGYNDTTSNKLHIGVTAANTLIYGKFDTGQVAINAQTVDASAALDVPSTTKGFLPPRMTTTQINAISSPATGLMVYNTTLNQMCFYNGSGWRKITDSNM